MVNEVVALVVEEESVNLAGDLDEVFELGERSGSQDLPEDTRETNLQEGLMEVRVGG